ncbi:MAG TPA: tetratricopeptide repeat protein [Edaphobacter sp.]|nr:tetratricopeptide repeat protein [Edaphobacter sp.]
MAILSITRALATTLLLPVLLLPAASIAQTPSTQNPPPAPCPPPNQTPDQTAKPCPQPAAKKPSVADEHPFPGDPPKPANQPNSPAPKTTPAEAAAQHPFPTQPPPKLPGDDSSSSSSSSSGDDPSATPSGDNPTPGGNPPEGTSVHRKLPKVKRVQSDDERVDEDLSVGKFYLNDENYAGAYLRAKDAVQVQPEYSATHFLLAEVLQKMKKKDEAIAEYKTYLKLDPDGEKAKAAQKALDELQ